MTAIRGDRRGDGGQGHGLRQWENDDLVPRPDDVFQERPYCVRWRLPSLADLLWMEQRSRAALSSGAPPGNGVWFRLRRVGGSIRGRDVQSLPSQDAGRSWWLVRQPVHAQLEAEEMRNAPPPRNDERLTAVSEPGARPPRKPWIPPRFHSVHLDLVGAGHCCFDTDDIDSPGTGRGISDSPVYPDFDQSNPS